MFLNQKYPLYSDFFIHFNIPTTMVACNGTLGITKEKDSPGAQHQSVLFLILDVLQKEKTK